jgi:disulfide bond formation protein DsbB
VPHCDIAAWRLFGISMAGYNALISLGTALLGAVFLARRT